MNIREVSFKDIFTFRPFILMWVAMFTSTIGTFLLLLVLAAQIFSKTNSSFDAGIIFAAQWVLPIFLFSRIGKLTSSGNIKKILITSELTGAFISLLIGIFAEGLFVHVILLLILRGFFEALTKTGREVAFKIYIPQEFQAKASSLFESSYYFGTGFGGLLGALLIDDFSIFQIAVIDSITFLISSICYLSLAPNFSEKTDYIKKSISDGLQIVRDNKHLFLAFSFLLLNVAIFQGFHNVARTVLPIQELSLGKQGTQYLQIVFCLAITISTLFFAKYLTNTRDQNGSALWRVILTSFSLGSAVLVKNPIMSFTFYFIFAFLFEISFLRHKTDMRLLCNHTSIGHVSALFYALAHLMMISIILILGKSSDWIGFQQASFALGLISILLSLFIIIKYLEVNSFSSLKGYLWAKKKNI